MDECVIQRQVRTVCGYPPDSGGFDDTLVDALVFVPSMECRPERLRAGHTVSFVGLEDGFRCCQIVMKETMFQEAETLADLRCRCLIQMVLPDTGEKLVYATVLDGSWSVSQRFDEIDPMRVGPILVIVPPMFRDDVIVMVQYRQVTGSNPKIHAGVHVAWVDAVTVAFEGDVAILVHLPAFPSAHVDRKWIQRPHAILFLLEEIFDWCFLLVMRTLLIRVTTLKESLVHEIEIRQGPVRVDEVPPEVSNLVLDRSFFVSSVGITEDALKPIMATEASQPLTHLHISLFVLLTQRRCAHLVEPNRCGNLSDVMEYRAHRLEEGFGLFAFGDLDIPGIAVRETQN